ncbi:MAG: hypothetical protein AAF939_21485 [Planctomycetota bacterium]
MSESQDVQKFTETLKRQRALSVQLESLTGNARKTAQDEIKELRRVCLQLVEKHFHECISQKVAQKFPQKVLQGQHTPIKKRELGVVAQFTELLNDFFVEVLGKDDSVWWKLETPIELRNYATRALINRAISKIRRQEKFIPVGDDKVTEMFHAQVAQEICSRFRSNDINPEKALELIQRWDEGDDELFRKYALVLRLTFVAAMKDHQIENDLKNTFDLRDVPLPLPLKEVAKRVGAPLSTVGRWKLLALQELRKQLASQEA